MSSSDGVAVAQNVDDSSSIDQACDWRQSLPASMLSKESISVWSVLKKFVGKDLTRISIPAVFNEPLSFLQRLAECMEYSELLKCADQCSDQVERFDYVAAFVISTLSSNHLRLSKPFNPLWFETFELDRRSKEGYRYIAEQVSHHPPVSALHVDSDLYTLDGVVSPQLKLCGTTIEAHPCGTFMLKLLRHNETYSWNPLNVSLHNVIMGEMYMKLKGTMTITSDSGSEYKLYFQNDGGSKRSTHFSGHQFQSGRIVKAAYGTWTTFFATCEAEKFEERYTDWFEANKDFFDLNSQDYLPVMQLSKVLWHCRSRPKNSQSMYNFTSFTLLLNDLIAATTKLPLTDSRLRPDIRLLESGQIDAAEKQKEELEVKQRGRRTQMKKSGRDTPPRWFDSQQPNKQQLPWVFNGFICQLLADFMMGNAESNASIYNSIEVGEPVSQSSAVYRLWSSVNPCVETKKRQKLTIFVRNFAITDSVETKKFFENGIVMLRKLRHPYIVNYKSSSIDNQKYSLITERVQMLDLSIENQSPIEIHTGLIHILEALIFLHDKAQICHNNISPLSVFVIADGRWKLGGFECAQLMEATRHWVQSDFVRMIKMPEFAPPEDKSMLCNDIPPTARDAYAYGKLISFVLPYLERHMPQETLSSLCAAMNRLCSEDAIKRGELGSLSESYPCAFTNRLTATYNFLRNLHNEDAATKSTFFKQLNHDLKQMPQEVVAKCLVPLIFSRHVMLDSEAHNSLIPFVLRPSNENGVADGLFSEDMFRRWVVPELLKLFKIHETTIRLALLSHFSLYMNYFSEIQLEKVILAELLLGMQDANDRIVSASMHTMADLVFVIGGARVTGSEHKRIFADGTPNKNGIFMSSLNSPKRDTNAIQSPRLCKETGIMDPPSPNLLGLLLDDELSDQPNIKLQLQEMNYEESAKVNISKVPFTDDWSDAWDEKEANYNVSDAQNSNIDSKEITVSDASGLGTKKDTFDLKYGIPEIDKKALCNVEPDYFADMEPIVRQPPTSIDTSDPLEDVATKMSKKPLLWKRFEVRDHTADEIGSWETTSGPCFDED